MLAHRRFLLTAFASFAIMGCDKAPAKGSPEGERVAATSPNATAAVTEEKSAPGKPVKVAFSAPGADHGWLAAIVKNAREEAKRLGDVTLEVSEGATDPASQASQIDALVAGKPDVLVVLPTDGQALTPAAQAAMRAHIPVVAVDRELASPSAYRTWIGGDNYGIGFSAGNYIAEQLNCKGNVVEIQGIAGISVTELRTKGFNDAIKRCNNGVQVVARQAANFLPDKGLEVMEAILQAQKKIDAVYTHDDDMAMGVVSAIQNAKRDKEMFVTGAGGSKRAMDLVKNGSLYRATFLYNPSMAASAIRLARLIGQGKGLRDLTEPEVPSRIQVPATAVTKENVNTFLTFGYE
ncbi:substrate-binding domain-containing protein [Pendulispora brunnea]|uniref:Substrate-binding domain-containing protein n=1 Tax=Pendulispora brunnea TaxID=2905690 RepID=A0ABZ2K3M6_9BACT